MLKFQMAETAESIHGVADQVSDIIETAGDTAGSLITRLPALTTKLLIAAIAIFLGVLIIRLGRHMIEKLVKNRALRVAKNTHQVNTLKSLLTSAFNYIMYFIILTVVLSLFGVNVSSILAVAGVGGIAIAFGAQTLVQDVISGLFIWGEGSITVGDVVDINGLQGEVEAVSVRTTVIRNYNGNVYTIPNGDIRTITNMSRNYKRAIVDIRCPYEADQNHIGEIITEEMEKAGQEIEGLNEAPEVMSILSFDVDAVLVRVAAICPVGENWRIERDIRTRIKARFDKEGIVMPHYQKPPVS